MPNKSETVLSWILTAAAVVIAATLVHRELSGDRLRSELPDPNDPPTVVDDWQMLPAEGIVVGDSSAPVMVVQFADLECPFCRQFHELLEKVRSQHNGAVAYSFIHFPLQGHQHAYGAARAAECAERQGRFAEFVNAVFADQERLGKTTWTEFAMKASIADTVQFLACTVDTGRVDRVDRGKALGALLKVRGTPTVIINGLRYPVPPDSAKLERIVLDALSQRRGAS